jgi:hypothetical protein
MKVSSFNSNYNLIQNNRLEMAEEEEGQKYQLVNDKG